MLKELVVASKIRKNIGPITAIINAGMEEQMKMIPGIIDCNKEMLTEAAVIIKKNANNIATAVVALEPLFKQFASNKKLKKSFENLITACTPSNEYLETVTKLGSKIK